MAKFNTVPSKLVPAPDGEDEDWAACILTIEIRTPDHQGSDRLTPTLVSGIYAPQTINSMKRGFWAAVANRIGKYQ